jgi:hypothetical protein
VRIQVHPKGDVMAAPIRMILVAFSITLATACGSPTGGDDDDDGGTPDAPPASNLDPSDCAPIAANFAAGADMCGAPLPGGAQAQLETMCKKGIAAAAMCGGNPAAGFDCFATPDPTDWACSGGEPLPACNGDLAASLGMYCVIALGNPACASGIQCDFDADCSNGLGCNGATKQCFSKTAYCVGLPCQFDADCPASHTCNGAEKVCVGA